MEREVLAIVGKLPRKGFSKTRLASDLDEESALTLYEAFIDDFFERIPYHYEVYFFGTPREKKTQEYFSEKRALSFHYQEELPFFQRLAHVFQTIERHEGSKCFVHLTGTDIPDFPFEELEKVRGESSVAIGPDLDGGYYYLGARASRRDLFCLSAVDGSRSVFEETLRLCQRKGDKVQLLQPWSDIDTFEDLRRSSLYEKYKKILRK